MAVENISDYVHKILMSKIIYDYDRDSKTFYYVIKKWGDEELSDGILEAFDKLKENYAESEGIEPSEIKLVRAEWAKEKEIYDMYK